jgi:hypothetical protein
MNAVQSAAALPERRGRGTVWLIALVLVLIVILLGGGGTLLWNFVAARAGSALDDVLAREAEHGHTITCPQRQFSGFPLRMAFDCTAPTYAGDAGGHAITASAKGLHVQYAILQPDRITAEIEGPVEISSTSPDGKTLSVTLNSLRATALGLPFGIDRVSLAVDKPAAQMQSGAGDPLSVAAQSLSVELHRLVPDAPQDPDGEVTLNITGLVSPLFDKVMGTTEAANVDAHLAIHQAGAFLFGQGSPADRAEAWRAEGGRLDILHAALQKGPANVEASGTLAIDDGHRPKGDIDLSLAGVEGVLKRFGLPVHISGLGGLFGGLLGKKTDPSGPSSALRLGLKLIDGRVFMGPLPLPVALRPLY